MFTKHNFNMNSIIKLTVDFHAKVQLCETFASLNVLCLRLTKGMGLDALAYHHLPQVGAVDDVCWNVVAVGFPKEMVEEYQSEEQYKLDPTIRTVMSHTKAHWWRDVDYSSGVSKEEMEHLKASSQKVGEGVIMPVFGPHGRNGFVALSFGEHKPDGAEDAVPLIQSCCQLAHLQYCALLQVKLPNALKLSRREKEVLSWVAQGKSNGVIAKILGIAESTIITHLERSYKKLGVNNRVTASLRASSLGELNYFL